MRVYRHIAAMARGRKGRFTITLLALIAFTFQSYLTQIHMHTPAGPGVLALMAALDPLDAPVRHGKNKQDPANTCPICQAVIHAGAFVSPSAAVIFTPTLSVQIIAILIVPPIAIEATSHSWQSRAPPRR